MELNCEPSEVFHREYSCNPPLVDWKEPAGYVTCRTGPVGVSVEPGAGALGKGSSTNAISSAPFSILPLLRLHPETRNDCASELERVAVGNGRLVLVVSEYWEAREVGETVVEAARLDTG